MSHPEDIQIDEYRIKIFFAPGFNGYWAVISSKDKEFVYFDNDINDLHETIEDIIKHLRKSRLN